MFVTNLRRIFIIILICISALSVAAQQNHFVYLQTENGQPFYIKLNNKILSSSPAGYIILPRLKEGDYQMVLGFPKNEYPEENFQFSIHNSNEGFLLKNFGEKGWSLFNLQTLTLLSGATSNKETVKAKIQDDPFATMLASVVKDSSLLQKNESTADLKDTTLQKNEVVKSEMTDISPKASLKNNADSLVTIRDTSSVSARVTHITNLLKEKDKDGVQLVYLDNGDNNNDTVRIYIPAEKNNSKADETVIGNNQPPRSQMISGTDSSNLTITPTIVKIVSDTITLVNDTIKLFKDNKPKDEAALKTDSPDSLKREVKIRMGGSEQQISPKENKNKPANKDEIIILPKVVTFSKVNSDCKEFASDADFLKLRKKMASENNNDDMIRMAKKVFHTKCFSTEQIKNLSFLFLTDEGKYRFFDAAYPFSSDSDQYYILESQLTDEYYINRFNAMIHK